MGFVEDVELILGMNFVSCNNFMLLQCVGFYLPYWTIWQGYIPLKLLTDIRRFMLDIFFEMGLFKVLRFLMF